MKANAPEKVYCVATEGGFYLTTTKPEPPFAEGVEYTRTDAFIEKAAKWINEHTSLSEKLVIENFVTYMKRELCYDFEEALAKEWKGYNDRGAATVDALEDNTQELAFAKGFYRGWNYSKQLPVNEDLEEAASLNLKNFQKK